MTGCKVLPSSLQTTIRDVHFKLSHFLHANFTVMFGLLSSDSQEVIERNEVIRRVREWNPGFDPECLSTLFEGQNKVNFEQFSNWVDSNPRALGLSEWLLFPDSNLTMR